MGGNSPLCFSVCERFLGAAGGQGTRGPAAENRGGAGRKGREAEAAGGGAGASPALLEPGLTQPPAGAGLCVVPGIDPRVTLWPQAPGACSLRSPGSGEQPGLVAAGGVRGEDQEGEGPGAGECAQTQLPLRALVPLGGSHGLCHLHAAKEALAGL